MNIRPKTFRRLLILFAALTVLLGVLTCVIVVSVHRNARAMKQIRAEAMTAFRAGDYAKSVDLFQTYRDMAGAPDPDAEFAYGVSRIHVELPNGKHLIEGIHIFERYLQSLKPGDPEAERQLLQLYVARGYFTEAIHTADDLLAVNPRDGEALREKVLALVGQHQPQQALEVNEKLNAIEPLNLHGQVVTIMLLAQMNTPAEQVIAHAAALQKVHPADPRFETLMAYACSQEKQDDAARKWLMQASTRKPPDAQFVADLALQLDEIGLFAESYAFLSRSADLIAGVAVQRMLAERLWEDGKISELEERLKSQTPQSPRSDGVLMAYRALALYADVKTQDADALVKALSLRSDAPSAAWAIALQARFAKTPLTASDLASRFQAAVTRDPENPVLHEMLAEAYLRMNESELVIQQCVLASQHAKSWSAPFLMMAEAQTTTGRQGEAVESARQALDRAPNRYETRLMRAKTFFAWATESGLPSDYENLLAYLQEMQQTYHDAQTLPWYVAVLARTGHREQALTVVQEAMRADPPLPMQTLAELAETCDGEKLDLGQQVRETALRTQGVSPEMSLSEARAMLRDGKGAEGLQLLLKEASGHEKEISWRIAVALYREAFGQGALRDWIALGDQYPGDLQVQQTILRAQSRIRDRAFWATTIARVQAITGEQGILWRMERSRWLLAGALSERDKAEAVNLLTQVASASPSLAEPHRLLALAMEKVNNAPGALAELTTAADAHPGDLTITRELFRLLMANNRDADALYYLDKLAKSRELTVDGRQWVARTYAEQGRPAEAAAMLRPLLAASSRWRAIWLDLAVRQKDLASASAWIEEAAPLIPSNSSAEQCSLATAWYAVGAKFDSSSAFDSAARILQPLTSGPDEILQASILTAMIAQRRSDYDTAESAYRRVLKRKPNSPDCLNDLAYLLWLRGRDADMNEARRMVESAIAMRPNDASFYDTLARIQAKAGEIHLARQTFRIALQKDPNSLEAMIGQADLLSHDPASRQEARNLIEHVKGAMSGEPQLSPVLRKQYQAVRDTLASSF